MFNSINYLTGSKTIKAQRFAPREQFRAHFLGAAVSVGGSILASLMAPGGSDMPKPKILPKTVSNSTLQDFDVLYDFGAIKSMYNLADGLAKMADEDRSFFNEVYKPFQESMAAINQKILPAVEKTSGAALEHITKSLVSGEQLTEIMKAKAEQGLDPQTQQAFTEFKEQLTNLPTESERVGQALVNVEGAFSAAGKQLSRDYQSRGQTVSQASQRDLLMEKAKAKAGAAGAASEASRKEHLAAAEKGAGLEMQREQFEQGLRTGAVTTAAQFGGLAQSAAGASKQAIMQIDPITGLEQTKQAGDLMSVLSQQQFGTRTRGDSVQHTQKGIKKPVITTGAGTDVNGTTVGGVGSAQNAEVSLGSGGAGGLPGGGSNLGAPQGNRVGTQNIAGGFDAVAGGPFDESGSSSRRFTTGMKLGKTVKYGSSIFHVEDDGDIINLQTGGILDSTLKEGDRDRWDTDQAMDRLRQMADNYRGPSTMTNRVVSSNRKRDAAYLSTGGKTLEYIERHDRRHG